MLTVGEVRRLISRLDDDCTVEVNVLHDGRTDEGYGDEVSAEVSIDGNEGWLSINVNA